MNQNNSPNHDSSSKLKRDEKQSYNLLPNVLDGRQIDEDARSLEGGYSTNNIHENNIGKEVVAAKEQNYEKKDTIPTDPLTTSLRSSSASNAVAKRCNSFHVRLQEVRRQSFPLLSYDLVEDLEESFSSVSSTGDVQVLDFIEMEANILQVNQNHDDKDDFIDDDDGHETEEKCSRGGRCHKKVGSDTESGEVVQESDQERANRLQFDLDEEEREFKLDLDRSKLDRMSLISDITRSFNSVLSEFDEMENILDELVMDMGNHGEMLTKKMEKSHVPHKQTQQQRYGGIGRISLGENMSKVVSNCNHDGAAALPSSSSPSSSSSPRSSHSSSEGSASSDDADLLDFLNDLPRKSYNIGANDVFSRILALDFDEGNEDDDTNKIQKFFGRDKTSDCSFLAKKEQIGQEIDWAEPRDSVDVIKLRQARQHEKWSNTVNGHNYVICDVKKEGFGDHHSKQHDGYDNHTATTVSGMTETSVSTFANPVESKAGIDFEE